MTRKQERFIAEYLVDMNATQAALRAGYGKKSAMDVGRQLLRKTPIRSAIARAQSKQIEKIGVSAERVLEELARLALVDARGFWDEHGDLKPMKDLTAEQGACLASFEAIIKNAKAGDGVTDTIHKIKLWDKTRALETLAKHFGLLREIHEHHFKLEDLVAGSMEDEK